MKIIKTTKTFQALLKSDVENIKLSDVMERKTDIYENYYCVFISNSSQAGFDTNLSGLD